jgi:molybdate transport system ATP-binding protein
LFANLLEVGIEHRVGALSLNVNFTLNAPWTVLFGASGSGKTTVLRAIAGFVRPDAGRIVVRGEVLADRGAGIWVPAHARPVRTAGQVARLFPQMTVRENAVYGQGWTSKPNDTMKIAEEVLRLFRLEKFAERFPRELSGGESQRVSVARAVVSAVTFAGPGTALLLLDEPFGGLDLKLRDELLVALQAWLAERKVPVLSVTHDVGEVFLLGAEVIRLAEGCVVDQGPVGGVLAAERERVLGQLRG